MNSCGTPRKEEKKIIYNSQTIVKSNKNNNYLIFFDVESDFLLIQARKKDDYFNKTFSNKFTLEKIRENKYFSLFVGLKEIYDEIKEIIKIKEMKIIEEENILILSISLPNIKTKEIIFELNKEKKTVRDIFNEISDMFTELKKEINELKSENREINQINLIQKNEITELKQNLLNQKNEIDKLKQSALNQEKGIFELKNFNESKKEKELNELKQNLLKPEIEINELNEFKSDQEKQKKEINDILYKLELLKKIALSHDDEIIELKQITLMNNNELAELKKIPINKKDEIIKLNEYENNVINKKKEKEVKPPPQPPLKQKENNIEPQQINVINKIIDLFKEKIKKEEIIGKNQFLFNNNLDFATDIYNISKNPLPKNFKAKLKFNSVSWVRVGITFDKEIVKDKTDENKPLYDIYYILEDLNQFYDLSHGWRTNIFNYDGGKLKSGDELTIIFKNGKLSYEVNEIKIKGFVDVEVYNKNEYYLLVHRRDAKTICQILSIEEIF